MCVRVRDREREGESVCECAFERVKVSERIRAIECLRVRERKCVV